MSPVAEDALQLILGLSDPHHPSLPVPPPLLAPALPSQVSPPPLDPLSSRCRPVVLQVGENVAQVWQSLPQTIQRFGRITESQDEDIFYYHWWIISDDQWLISKIAQENYPPSTNVPKVAVTWCHLKVSRPWILNIDIENILIPHSH